MGGKLNDLDEDRIPLIHQINGDFSSEKAGKADRATGNCK